MKITTFMHAFILKCNFKQTFLFLKIVQKVDIKILQIQQEELISL